MPNPVIDWKTIAPSPWPDYLREGRCFILADAALNNAVPWLAQRYAGSEQHASLLWADAARIHASAAPYCIPATTESWPVISEHLTPPYIAMQLEWFYGAYSPPRQHAELVHHLRCLSLATDPQNEKTLLRLTDWRVLTTLINASTPAQTCAHFGPVHTFFNIEKNSLQTATLTRRTPDTIQPTPPHPGRQHWQLIAAHTAAKRQTSLATWLREHHPRWRQATDTEIHTFINEQTRHAQQYGFTSERDLIRWLSLHSELPADFITTPQMQALLLQTGQQPASALMDALYKQAIRDTAQHG